MDIYSVLKKDHDAVKALFEKAIKAPDDAKRYAIYETIKSELLAHAKAEEKTYYTAIKKKNEKLKEEEEHAEHEHEEIEGWFAKVDKEKRDTPAWLVAFGELKHSVEHHVEDEEGKMFKDSKKALTKTEAEELGEKMVELKEKELGKKKAA